MSMYAYTAASRRESEKILAKNITKREKGVRYYCPNPQCNAKMFVRCVEGERKTFFAASGNPGHIENCLFGSSNTYNPEKTTEEGFDADDAIKKLMEIERRRYIGNENKSNEKEKSIENKIVPHTIKQIYDMCKSYDCKDTFNNQTIGQILVDDRSVHMYPKGIYRYRIIEAKCKKKLYDNMDIYLETPLRNEKYSLKLHFEDKELFYEIRKKLFANQDHMIVIAGEWKSAKKYHCFVTEFKSRRQILIMKQKI